MAVAEQADGVCGSALAGRESEMVVNTVGGSTLVTLQPVASGAEVVGSFGLAAADISTGAACSVVLAQVTDEPSTTHLEAACRGIVNHAGWYAESRQHHDAISARLCIACLA